MSELDASTPVAAWRTVLVTAFVVALQFAGFAIGVRKGFTSESASAYASLCTWTTAAAIGVAAKALGEHLGGTGGIAGAAKALFTSAKPEGT